MSLDRPRIRAEIPYELSKFFYTLQKLGMDLPIDVTLTHEAFFRLVTQLREITVHGSLDEDFLLKDGAYIKYHGVQIKCGPRPAR